MSANRSRSRITKAERATLLDEREFWLDIGRRFHLGRLLGWSYKSSATFVRGVPPKAIEVDSALLEALLETSTLP